MKASGAIDVELELAANIVAKSSFGLSANELLPNADAAPVTAATQGSPPVDPGSSPASSSADMGKCFAPVMTAAVPEDWDVAVPV